MMHARRQRLLPRGLLPLALPLPLPRHPRSVDAFSSSRQRLLLRRTHGSLLRTASSRMIPAVNSSTFALSSFETSPPHSTTQPWRVRRHLRRREGSFGSFGFFATTPRGFTTTAATTAFSGATQTTTTTATIARRYLSDRLLGYSPMAPPSPAPPPSSLSQDGDTLGSSSPPKIPTASDVTLSGGVWAPTSAKREKLRELKVQLTEDGSPYGIHATLDDRANPDQLLDLHLTDGLLVLTRLVDEEVWSSMEVNDADGKEANDTTEHLRSLAQSWIEDEATSNPAVDEANQVRWTDFCNTVVRNLEERLVALPPERYLRYVRDFYLPDDTENDTDGPNDVVEAESLDASSAMVQDHVRHSVLRFRLLLAVSMAEHLRDSWKDLTAITDQDIDRAAVRGETLDAAAKTLSLARAQTVLEACLFGTATDRVDALWNLVDRDADGLLDEVEMGRVCELAIEPHRRALRRLFQDALLAHPVRAAPLPQLLPPVGVSGEPTADVASPTSPPPPPRPGWRQRRREAKEQKRLTRTMEKTLKTHFVDEVEMPHRLRCSYAWANKAHQNNRIDSVLVGETSGWGGRQRYVELHPKISLHEFREVQREHFPQLDRIGSEFVKSFREELWIDQGKGRNRRTLLRNCSLFLAVVCSTDLLIGTL